MEAITYLFIQKYNKNTPLEFIYFKLKTREVELPLGLFLT